MNGFTYDLLLGPLDKWKLQALRHELVSQATGETLEIGAGTGLNLMHYSKAVPILVALEPDASMRDRAKNRSHTANTQFIDGNVESLPFQDGIFDSVVATLVFCSVEHPDTGLKEIYRVLKPGGKFLLLEHVRRNTPIAGRFLDALTPLWSKIGSGCHLNRNP